MNNIKIFGKFLDQPLLISKLNKKMPVIMGVASSAILAHSAKDTFEKTKDKEKTKKETLKKGFVLASAVASALVAPKIAAKITKRMPIDSIENIKQKNQKLIDEFTRKNPLKADLKQVLEKAKDKVLSFKEIKKLANELNNDKNSQKFFNQLIPDPENISAKDIFSEIGYLSIYGAIPVAGGILGGIGADIATKDEKTKENIPDKINEGIYQYLANIFMCNIGAGAALAMLEKANITSKAARAIGMTSGIILTGILGGSKIANTISKGISPILSPNKKPKERKPELLDAGLHVDDIATVSLLSGLKWIEPALPALYSISGYKAGVGYRN
ncbi:hypothetical protein IJ425_02160 [bacterium]|nr:hypothetical protein [bacterium]